MSFYFLPSHILKELALLEVLSIYLCFPAQGQLAKSYYIAVGKVQKLIPRMVNNYRGTGIGKVAIIWCF